MSGPRHGVDAELAEGTFELDSTGAHPPKEEGAPRVKRGIPAEGQRDRHPALPAGRHQGDRAATELEGQVVPATVVHVQVEGHGAPGPQVDHGLAGEELQAQLQRMPAAADGKEEGVVHPVGAEAQHQGQLRAQGGGDQGGRGGLQLGPLREDEARPERNDPRGRGAPAAPCLRPAEAQPLEHVHIWEKRGRTSEHNAVPCWRPGLSSMHQGPRGAASASLPQLKTDLLGSSPSPATPRPCGLGASVSPPTKWDDNRIHPRRTL